METVGNMKLYTFEEVLDKQLGKKGTPRRDAHEMRVEEALHAYRIGEAIKKARLKQNLTQEELGEKVGVKSSITLSTMRRVFQALGITTATLDLGIGGKVALW